MALEVKRQPKETTQGLIRRFTKNVQDSRILFRARKIRFKERTKSKQMKKRAAVRKEELKKKYKKLEKLGNVH